MHWCLGMYASGSTWVFNAAVKVADAVSREKHATGRYITNGTELDPPPDIVKTHDTDDAAAAALRRLADAILVSVRDPRDCVTSLMLYQRYRLGAALSAVERSAQACARMTADPRAILLRYEDGFIDDPATLNLIAASFGCPLAEADRSRIFAEMRRPAIEAFIARLDTLPTALHHAASGDVVDTVSQWHTHHAQRSGEIGRWRHMLTAPQIAAIEQRMQDWMAAFDYPAVVAPYTLTIGSLAFHGR